MPVLAAFLGWSSQDWEVTIGLAAVFFLAFPIIVQGLIAFAVAQGLGERAENQKHAGRWGRKPHSDA